MGYPVDLMTMHEVIRHIDRIISENKKIQQVCLNMVKVVMLGKVKELQHAVQNADLVNVDGMGFFYALRLLNYRIPERIAGIDLMEKLLFLSAEKGYKIFLLGAKKEIVEKAAENIREKYGNIVAGYHHGYFSVDEEKNVVEEINKSKAQILFVGISSPKKEIFIRKYKDVLAVNFMMGVGGSFDVLAGRVKRAPRYFQNLGLEWLYRFMQEPFRIKKYLPYLIKFILLYWDIILRRKELVNVK